MAIIKFRKYSKNIINKLHKMGSPKYRKTMKKMNLISSYSKHKRLRTKYGGAKRIFTQAEINIHKKNFRALPVQQKQQFYYSLKSLVNKTASELNAIALGNYMRTHAARLPHK